MRDENSGERLLVLLLEQLRRGEMPHLLATDAWHLVNVLMIYRPSLTHVALELDVCGLAVAQLHANGTPADWTVRSTDFGASCHRVVHTMR